MVEKKDEPKLVAVGEERREWTLVVPEEERHEWPRCCTKQCWSQ